jgi:hypothetical protein
MSALQKRARATNCQSSGSHGNRESHFTRPLVRLLWNLRDTRLLETEDGEEVAFRDHLRQSPGDPDAEQTFPLVQGLVPRPLRNVQVEVGAGEQHQPLSLSRSPTSVLASTTKR